MEILIGIGVLLILIAIIIFEVFIYCALKMASEANNVTENTVEKPKKAELTDEQKKKQEKLREHFENLMGFDYEKALKSKGE